MAKNNIQSVFVVVIFYFIWKTKRQDRIATASAAAVTVAVLTSTTATFHLLKEPTKRHGKEEDVREEAATTAKEEDNDTEVAKDVEADLKMQFIIVENLENRQFYLFPVHVRYKLLLMLKKWCFFFWSDVCL